MGLHDKHRMRLDKKVCENGLEMLEPHEQLEYILFTVFARGDTNALAHRLLDRFISVAGVLNADVEELMEVDGVGHRTAMFLTSLPDLLGIVERSLTVDAPPQLDTPEKIEKFARTYFYGKLTEAAYLISLNSTYRILAVHKISDGAQHEIYVYPSRVVKRAIRDNASAVIVVHNHPCGSVKPSVDDIMVSRNLARALDAVDIVFADSVIISEGKIFSIQKSGYIDVTSREY